MTITETANKFDVRIKRRRRGPPDKPARCDTGLPGRCCGPTPIFAPHSRRGIAHSRSRMRSARNTASGRSERFHTASVNTSQIYGPAGESGGVFLFTKTDFGFGLHLCTSDSHAVADRARLAA